MFSEFENMFDKIKSSVKQVHQQIQHPEQDYAHTPQKYNVNGREFQQLRLLSQGAFGFIWLAEDIRTKQQFALKRVICMTEARLNESKKEKDIMGILPKSENLVQFICGDIIKKDEQRVVVTVMELCNGGTLFDMLEKRQKKGFTEKELVNIIFQILKGLDAIHTAGYIHRDVKIENVLAGINEKYKLCDFGSCTKQVYNFAEINKKDFDSIKEEIQSMTTPMYRPPQIVDPYLKYKVDSKVDIWMTGCVLYTLSYFIHPFVDSNAIGIASGNYKFPKYPQETVYKVSEKINDLIRHMLTPNPQFRPSSKQLIELLKNWDLYSQIPLNSQAQKRKKQEKIKQIELQQLNKKCVEFDGDIPIERLMELQRRLKKPQDDQKPSTFINKNIKGAEKLKDQNAYQTKIAPLTLNQDPFKGIGSGSQNTLNKKSNELFDSTNPFGAVSVKQKQVTKQQSKVADLWGSNFNQKVPSKTNINNNTSINCINSSQPLPSSNGDSFSFFQSFGLTESKSVSKPIQQENSLNFEQMFSQTPSNPSLGFSKATSNPSNQSHNLLDL